MYQIALLITSCLLPILASKSLLENAFEEAGGGEEYMPTKCEACLLFASEVTHSVFKLSKMPKKEGEVWLLEELEHICSGMLDYKLHKKVPGIKRFSKDSTRIANTFKDLGLQGVEWKINNPKILPLISLNYWTNQLLNPTNSSYTAKEKYTFKTIPMSRQDRCNF
uniref:DUF3456 domain-containing protein n=1 Tax=Ditylenchus dipsaci TaxID=166011 RepID=A0A915ESI1_9BILA